MLRSLLLDFNAFFASVEQWLNPAWRGLPLAVVPVMADSSCCIAASYEARAFGVKTGTRVGEARALCPGLVLVQAEHHRYVRVHEQALGVLERVAPIRQVLSIDEMEFELTGRWTQPQAAAQLGRDLKAAIRQEFGPTLRCSVGIAANTLLAKLASNMQKPDGLTLLRPEDMPAAILHLPIDSINGIGPRMARRLQAAGIDSMAALYAAPRAVLHAVWGSVAGSAMYAKLRGVPCALQTEPGLSLGHSHILPPAMRNPADALAVLQRLVHKAAMRLRRKQRYVSSLSIFVQTLHVLPDGKRVRDTQVRQAGLGQTCDTAFLLQATTQLWHSGLQWAPRPQAVGLQLRGLVAASGHTADLFDTLPHTVRTGSPPQTRLALYRAVDHLNAVYGKNTVYFASAQAGLDHAPMRIAFNRIPDLVSEQ